MIPFVQDSDFTLFVGDVRDVLAGLPDGSVDCVVTSPPYWGLRDYGTGEWAGGDPDCDHKPESNPERAARKFPEGTGFSTWTTRESYAGKNTCGKCGARRVDRQLGLEPTPDEYVENMVAVFREIRRVLAPHGTCWVNLGDSYTAAQGGRQSAVGEMPAAPLQRTNIPRDRDDVDTGAWGSRDVTAKMTPARGTTTLKPKDLVGVPWRVAFALQADGWYLRADVIWAKPNPMPESVTDRPTKAHEYVFLLSKRPRYWFDQEAVREPHESTRWGGKYSGPGTDDWKNGSRIRERDERDHYPNGGRNSRSVWEIATQPYPEAHFATYPEELVRRCLLAGCPEWVCRSCGKPRERIVERGDLVGKDRGGNYAGREDEMERARANRNHGTPGMAYETATVGWSDCGHADFRPGVVLDPFMGSGTTALVARRHGRRAIGVELNPQYAELAARRLSQLSLLAEVNG